MINLFFLGGKKYNKIINSQAEFDSLTIVENDRIKLNGSFEGTINVNQNNVDQQKPNLERKQAMKASQRHPVDLNKDGQYVQNQRLDDYIGAIAPTPDDEAVNPANDPMLDVRPPESEEEIDPQTAA